MDLIPISQALTFSDAYKVCDIVYGYEDCNPPGGGIAYLYYVQTKTNLAGICGSDAGCAVRYTSNPAATICTSKPECAWVTVDHAACLSGPTFTRYVAITVD